MTLAACLFTLSGCSDSSDSDDTSAYAAETSSSTAYSSGLSAMQMQFEAPEETDDDKNFTVVVLPDTQYYTYAYPETYYAQTEWIAQNASEDNIKFVIHLGDLIQGCDPDEEWEIADAAHDTLDNHGIPYSVTLGNHDYESDGDYSRDTTGFNEYFGASRFIGKPWYGGGYPDGTNDNSYYFFHSGDLDFLVLCLEYAPRKDTLTWAADIINSYPDYRVIAVTHAYLITDDYSIEHAEVTLDYDMIGSDGTTLFNEFISRYSNIFMVIAGHNPGDGVRSIEANDGHTIYEVLVDYQAEPNGGNGWFKTLEFSPSDDTILMTSQTVSDDVSTFSKTAYYSSDPEDHVFEISYDMGSSTDFSENINPVGFNDREINSTASGNQVLPSVAGGPSGYSVVVWEDDSDKDGDYDIRMRGFTADGAEYFGAITVNSDTDGTHINPDVAVDDSGNSVVVWQDDSDENGKYEIRMSGYTADGTCRFSNYTVNTVSDGQQVQPAVDLDSEGNFIVAWQDDSDGNGYYEICMRGFDPSGLQYFAQTRVNSISAGQQLNPDVAMLSNGNFVVAWEDDNDNDGSMHTYLRGFVLSDTPTEFLSDREVDTDGAGQQTDPALCGLAGGGFVIAWEDDNRRRGAAEIYTSGFDSEGAQYFIQKASDSLNLGTQHNPAIASDGDGYFAVSWQNDCGGTYDIMINAFNESGEQIMAQTRVNKDTNGSQTDPDVAIGNDGRIVAVWTDDSDGNGYYQIIGRGAYDFGFELYYGD